MQINGGGADLGCMGLMGGAEGVELTGGDTTIELASYWVGDCTSLGMGLGS